MSVWMLICALIGTIYGAVDFFPGKSALYLKMVTCGVGCQMFSRLFYVVYIMTQGNKPDGFHIGFLGMAGSFLFFLSANYGQMDTLVDDGTAAFRKTRLEALLVPCVLLAIYVLFFQQARDMESRISVGFMALFLIPCSYYHFKHIIIYDVESGLIRQLRAYNILALFYAFFVMIEYIAGFLRIVWLYAVSGTGTGLVSLALVPVLKRGYEKWIREA